MDIEQGESPKIIEHRGDLVGLDVAVETPTYWLRSAARRCAARDVANIWYVGVLVKCEGALWESWALSDQIPMFGSSDHAFYASSQVSDDASTVVEIRRSNSKEEVSIVIPAKLASNPLYSKLIKSFIDCQKVGAPSEIANLLGKIC
ncbi:Homeobox protein knotted-1-like 6 [Sarracenia purpurea var. burkii]